ncbi:MAG: hypothetical protein R2826_00050 [Thermoleophilia bacterium]
MQVLLGGYVLRRLGATTLPGFFVAILLPDSGSTGIHLRNQGTINRIRPETRSRIPRPT